MADKLLLYGASGYTGRLLAHAACEQGLAPVLSGRSEEKIRPVAEDLDVEWRVAGVHDPGQLDRALEGVGTVLNAAGPFSHTASSLVDACVRAGAHYLDVTG